MAEDAKPQGSRVLRPTVVGPRPDARPEGAGATPPPSRPLEPTTILPGAKTGNRDRVKQVPAPPPPVTPTAMPGRERKRFAVTPEQLSKLSPTAGAGLVAETIRQLNTVVIDAAAERQALIWGHRLQADYGRAVSRMLDLTQSDLFERSSSHLARLTQILGSIDLPAIAGVAPRGMLGGLASRLNARIDNPEEFADARREIEHLLTLLSDAAEPLLGLQEDLAAQDRQIDELKRGIEAAALAAEYLATHLREEQPLLATRYFDRGLALTQTLAQIQSDAPLRKLQTERPHDLVRAIQEVVLLVVPRWLGSVSGMIALAARRTPTPTEAGQLDHELRKILQQLKP